MGQVLIGVALIASGAAVAAAVLSRRMRPPHERTGELSIRIETQAAEIRRLADASVARNGAGDEVRRELSEARRVLELMRAREEERSRFDEEGRDVIRRLSAVMAGGASKGRAGENVLRDNLAGLPPSMLSTDLRIGGKVVEFGLILPDGKRLPIDSKWPAVAELEALESCDDATERERLAREIERVVTMRVREVAQYLDPSLTAPVAVAAVPDAAYSVLRRAHADAFAKGVVIVPYSSALAVLLFLYSLVQRFGEAVDLQSSLAEVSALLDQMEAVMENKFAKAAMMLTNGSDELRSQLGKARGSIARGRAVAPDTAVSDGSADPGPLSLVN
jgi:hypothetical protein